RWRRPSRSTSTCPGAGTCARTATSTSTPRRPCQRRTTCAPTAGSWTRGPRGPSGAAGVPRRSISAGAPPRRSPPPRPRPGPPPPRGPARRLGLREDAEVTLEANPGTLTTERLAGYRAAGVTRLSLGAQSFQPALLRTLGRDHTADQTGAAVESARAAGFGNVSLDLIFG